MQRKTLCTAHAPIHKIEEPKLKACSVVVGLDKDMQKVYENDKPKPKDTLKPKPKKIAADDKPKPKSKKIAAASVTPTEKSKVNIEPKEKATEVVSKETENIEPKIVKCQNTVGMLALVKIFVRLRLEWCRAHSPLTY